MGDALHIPGFYDSLGIFLAASLLPLKWAIIAFIAIPLVLTSYYAVYLIAIWIYVLIGIIYWIIKRKVMSKIGILAYILIQVVYALSWLILYSYYTHTFKYFGLYISIKGFYVLLFDAVVSICLAEILSRTIVSHKTIDLDFKRLSTIIVLGVVIASVSFYLVQVNEWGIVGGFHEVMVILNFIIKWTLYGYHWVKKALITITIQRLDLHEALKIIRYGLVCIGFKYIMILPT